MKSKKIAIALIATILSYASAFGVDTAQTSTPNNSSQPEKTAEDKKLPENVDGELAPVEVSAMRFSDSLYELPVNATVISSEQITNSNLTSVSEVLNRYSDVYIRNTGGGAFMGNPSIRGFGQNSQSRTLVVLDGQRLNNIDMAGINWGQIQINDVENIEVLYGSQTATYGNFSESGVIKISTKKWGKNGGTVGATYGENGEYSFYGTANYSTDDYYASASANYFHDSGYFANSLTWNKSATLNAGVRLDSKNELGFYANVGNMFVSWPGPIETQSLAELKNMWPHNLVHNHTQEERVDYMTVSGSWENKTGFGEGSAHLGLSIRDKNVTYDYSSWGYIGRDDSTLYTLSFDPKYRVYLGKDDECYAEAGVDFYYDHFDIDGYAGPYTGSYVSDINRYTISPWAGGKAQLDEIFSLIGSVRYEAAINDALINSNSYNDNDNELVQGVAAQIGINAKLSDSWNVYARFDQIYHYASIDERYSIWGFGSTYTNNNLAPEHGQNYEVGVNFAKNGFSFNGSLFYTHLNDEIGWNPNKYINENIGDTDRYGAQVRFAYNYNDMIGAFTSWTFVDAEYASGANNGKTIACVPDIVSKSGIWVKPIKYVMAELNFVWANEQYQEDYLTSNGMAAKVPQSYSLDLTVNVYPCEYARIFFAISNITNHMNCSYAKYDSWYGNCWYLDPGRTICCGVEFKF